MTTTYAYTVVAAPSPSPTPAKGGEGVKSGPIGLAVILVLCVVAYFLFKSMSKHLRRVREDFPVHATGRPADHGTVDHGTVDHGTVDQGSTGEEHDAVGQDAVAPAAQPTEPPAADKS